MNLTQGDSLETPARGRRLIELGDENRSRSGDWVAEPEGKDGLDEGRCD